MSIQLGTISQVYGGSGVYQGIAIIWDGNGKVYDYDVTQGTCVPVKGSRKSLINLNNIQWDYLGCFATITNRSGTVPYESVQRPSVTLSASMENGKYGYTRDGNTIVPFQFEQAEDFYGSLAIVSIRGAYGLLGLKTSDDAFKVVANNPTISYKKDKDKDLSHKFTLSVPDSWNMEDINVRVTNQDGAELPVVQEGTVYEFKADGGKELQDETLAGNTLDWYDFEARMYDPLIGRFHTTDPMAEKYFSLTPYGYCGNNPIKYIDYDGCIIHLADNYTGGMENIAKIAATTLGSFVLNQLIERKEIYTLNSTFWTSSSSYDSDNRKINYVRNPLYKEIPYDGGALNSMIAMGHETFHAFDHSNNEFNSKNAVYSKAFLEPRAVSFENYLRQAYSLSPLIYRGITTNS